MAGVQARVFRVSFTGELSYEVYVPAQHARQGSGTPSSAPAEPLGMAPFGTEAMHVLRAEKGYIIVGQEADGTATPFDIGLGWAVGKSKPNFVGLRSLSRPDTSRADRKQLVGCLSPEVLEEGAQIVADADCAGPMPMLGHVTSAYWSEALQRPIALALGWRMVAPGSAGYCTCRWPNGAVAVRVTEPVFYDKEGARLHG